MATWYKDLDFPQFFPNDVEEMCIRDGSGWCTYLNVPMGFDIETTQKGEKAYMYIWSLSVFDNVIRGNSWNQWVNLLEDIIEYYELNETRRVIVWIANLGFEFQFMRKWLDITSIFASEIRRPMKAIHDNCIEFRDALLISGSNLDMLAKMYDTKHKKAIGDLDYSIERNYIDAMNMSDIEYGYTDNDVLILSDFATIIWDKYISNGFCPLTKTNILRRKVRDGCTQITKVKDACESLHPRTWGHYKFVMNWLFRGGYNHANHTIVGLVLEHIKSADKTSSYPWAMLTYDKYPMSPFKPMEWCDDNLKKYAMWGVFIFTNIRSTTNHSIESYSKCIAIKAPLLDNGRIRKASLMCAALTDLDWITYNQYYTWDKVECLESYGALGGRLPSYLINPLMDDYVQKNKLKSEGMSDTPIYNIKKSEVNSYYGMTVTRMHSDEIYYINDEWKSEKRNEFYWKEKRNKLLSPFWGMWVCSVSRRDLLGTMFDIGNDAVYSDTDSIYFKSSKKIEQMIVTRNKDIRQGVIDSIGYYGFDDKKEHIIGLGEWDFENNGKCYKHFKTLGAKRYIKDTENELKTTIAGLPKTYFNDKEWDEVEPVFNNNMNVKHCKLRAVYNDEPHSDIINGVEMSEKSSVALVDTDFTLTMDDTWLETLLQQYTRVCH